jgi:hypothetical protein
LNPCNSEAASSRKSIEDIIPSYKILIMKKNLLSSTLLVPALILLLFTSCQKEGRYDTTEEEMPSAAFNGNLAESDLLSSVKDATSRFHSTNQAIKAGYLADEHCVSVPGLGGMGYHWVNPSLVDPVFDPLKPEAVLYATGPGGKLKLVALEYIVINVGQPAPMFGDQPFDVGGTPIPALHWSLHLWLYEHNPSGLFTPFNPNISCP